MKRFFLNTVFLIGLMAKSQINKGDVIVHIGRGLEYFREVSYNYKIKQNNNIVLDTTIKDDAGNFHWSFGADYAPVKWFSTGIRIKTNQYVTEKNKNTGYTPTARSYEINIPFHFRPVNTKIFYLILAPELGFSKLEYKTNNPNDNLVINGQGGYFMLNIQPSFIFKNFGFYLSVFSSSVNYKEMKSNYSTFDNFIITHWSGKGTGLQFGFHYRFKTKKDEKKKGE